MISSIISSISLVVSAVLAYYYIKDRRYKSYDIEHNYIKELITWHRDVVQTLIKLNYIVKKSSIDDKNEELVKLSSLIEEGRFYFPNLIKGDDYGNDKPLAYQGYRNLTLDLLVASYNLYDNYSSQKDIEKAHLMQRLFTSIIFDIVRPKHHLKRIYSLTDKYFFIDKSIDDFIDSNKYQEIVKFIWHD